MRRVGCHRKTGAVHVRHREADSLYLLRWGFVFGKVSDTSFCQSGCTLVAAECCASTASVLWTNRLNPHCPMVADCRGLLFCKGQKRIKS